MEEGVQKTKEIQPGVAQPKENENISVGVLEPEEGILVICEDKKEEKEEKLQKDYHRQVDRQVDAEEKKVLAPLPTEEDSSEIEYIVKTKDAQAKEGKGGEGEEN